MVLYKASHNPGNITKMQLWQPARAHYGEAGQESECHPPGGGEIGPYPVIKYSSVWDVLQSGKSYGGCGDCRGARRAHPGAVRPLYGGGLGRGKPKGQNRGKRSNSCGILPEMPLRVKYPGRGTAQTEYLHVIAAQVGGKEQ